MVKVNELNSLMCQLSDHGCTDGFCCYNKINNDLFLNNCNVRHSDSYYREMMIICNFKGEIFFKSKQLQSQCSVLPIGACTQEIVTNTFSAIKPLSQCPLV